MMLDPYSRESWLNQYGGRTTKDLREDEKGEYVEMYSPDEEFGIERVYIPTYLQSQPLKKELERASTKRATEGTV